MQANPGVPNLIADMNTQDLAFSVHDGDLKGGNGPTANPPSVNCDDSLYLAGLAYLNQLEAPAMFTPGDNDWTDCDRPSNGGFNSLERLDHERQVFFGSRFSAGAKKQMQQEVQSTPSCLGYVSGPAAGPTVTKPVPCVENRRWTFKNVTYVTLNVQGSCNNLCDTAPDPAEYAARNAADIAWLHETFTQAKANGSVAVMIISQADPGFDGSDGTRTRFAIRRRWPRSALTPMPTASRTSSSRCGTRRSPSAARSPTSTATPTTSESTSRSKTPREGASRTSLGSKRLATTQPTDSTTCTG